MCKTKIDVIPDLVKQGVNKGSYIYVDFFKFGKYNPNNYSYDFDEEVERHIPFDEYFDDLEYRNNGIVDAGEYMQAISGTANKVKFLPITRDLSLVYKFSSQPMDEDKLDDIHDALYDSMHMNGLRLELYDNESFLLRTFKQFTFEDINDYVQAIIDKYSDQFRVYTKQPSPRKTKFKYQKYYYYTDKFNQQFKQIALRVNYNSLTTCLEPVATQWNQTHETQIMQLVADEGISASQSGNSGDNDFFEPINRAITIMVEATALSDREITELNQQLDQAVAKSTQLSTDFQMIEPASELEKVPSWIFQTNIPLMLTRKNFNH